MTKTEYREYIAGEDWQKRRLKFLEVHSTCADCSLPRWLAVIAYDQDLHVHHRSYARIGKERDSDLLPLCRRCHEVRTFGRSRLHAPRQSECELCGEKTWDSIWRRCVGCSIAHGGAFELSRVVDGSAAYDLTRRTFLSYLNWLDIDGRLGAPVEDSPNAYLDEFVDWATKAIERWIKAGDE